MKNPFASIAAVYKGLSGAIKAVKVLFKYMKYIEIIIDTLSYGQKRLKEVHPELETLDDEETKKV